MIIDSVRRLKSRHAPHGSFVAHVITLMTGTSIAQAIPIAITPILTRLYTPADFGILAVFTSLVSVLAIIATGRYELAIMLPDKEKDAVNVLALSLVISASISLFSFLILWIFNAQISSLLGDHGIAPWLYLAPISVFLTSTYQSINYWFSRLKMFKRITAFRLIQSTSTASTNLFLGFLGFEGKGLLVGSLIGQGLASGLLTRYLLRDCKKIMNSLSIKAIKDNASKYRDFPLINSFHAFMDAIQTSGIIFLISIYFGSVALGLYSLTFNILRLPLNLIGASVAQVFYQKASETNNNGEQLYSLTRTVVIKLSLLALPIFCIVFSLSPFIFCRLFGTNWEESGKYARILSPWLFLNFIASPISQIPIILNKQRTGLMLGLVYNSVIFSSLLLTSYLGRDLVTGLCLLSTSGSIVLLYYILWILRISAQDNGQMVDYAR
jgi:O-antigen/teichoic acid export membrane protein